ncbi:MAG: TrkH family potassium uptake protein [Geminicoccaceae bacterium]|nr:TrkH family potassium uptake protein [Geminicoccaceae bacterium]MCB9945466.1 TrkH family potassium uptake protein [Geminicoccaceae bacterium]
MIPPLIADLVLDNPDWQVFFVSACATCFLGAVLVLMNRGHRTGELTIRQGFVLTNTVWLVTSLFGALPLMLSGLGIGITDAFFEAASGLTTTGATVLTGLDNMPRGILLWRAILQWLGGIGIIVMGIAVLPMLNIGGMQLFRTESSDRSEKILPRAAQIASNSGVVYVLLTILCAAAYMIAGMESFEAVAHSMTTLSTGGLSTRDASIGGFNNSAIEWTSSLFMTLAGLPFVLYIQFLRGSFRPIVTDVQVRWYLCIIGIGVAALATEHFINGDPFQQPGEILRHSVFGAVTVITGTGYSADDYSKWGPLAIAMIFFYSCIGGCTGSTTGGIKIFRFVVLYQISRVQLLRLFQPSGVFRVVYNRRTLADATATSVLAFIFIFGLTFVVVCLLLAMSGLDFVAAMSGSIAALANVGPGLGPIIGPAGNYATVTDSAKWVLSFAMLAGRLELFTILVLFVPAFWRA